MADCQRLAQTDVSLFQRIRQWLSDLVIRLRGTEEQKRVLEVQRLYEKAARNVGAVQDRGAQYQIRQDTEGDDFVQVDEDILNGKTEKEHAAKGEQIRRELLALEQSFPDYEKLKEAAWQCSTEVPELRGRRCGS